MVQPERKRSSSNNFSNLEKVASKMTRGKSTERAARSRTPMRSDKLSKKKKEKKKKKKSKQTAATLYAALDMVTPKNVLCQLDEIRHEESIVKLEIEDLIVSGNGQSEELLVKLSQFFFEGNRQWEMINFKDNVGLHDLKAWLRSKREAMDFFEDLFRERPGVLGFESLMFQANMEVEEGTAVGNLFSLFRNIKRQRRVINVKILMDEEEMDEGALSEFFQEDSLGKNGELPETVVVLVTFGWMPDPDGLLLVDACLKMARDLGGLATSNHSASSGPALSRSNTDPCTPLSSTPFRRSSTHTGSLAHDRWAEEEAFPDPNQWFEEDARPNRRRLNASGAREARRSIRGARTSIRAPLQNGRGRRQTQVSPAQLRRQSRSNIQELKNQSTRQPGALRSSTPNIALGKPSSRHSRLSSPNIRLGRRSMISPSGSKDDMDSSSSSLHSSDLSSSGNQSGSDGDSSNDDSFPDEVSIDESTRPKQSATSDEEDAFGEITVAPRREQLTRSLSESRGLGSPDELAAGRDRSNAGDAFAGRKITPTSKSAHGRRSIKALESSEPLLRRTMMTRSASASSLVGKASHNQRDRGGRSAHQRKSIMRNNLGSDNKIPSSHRRGPGGVGMARSASTSNMLGALDEDVAKSIAMETFAATKSSRRGRRSIRDIALPPATAQKSIGKSNTATNLLGKFEWTKGGSKPNETTETSKVSEKEAGKSNNVNESSPVVDEEESKGEPSQSHERRETAVSSNLTEIKVKRSISMSSLTNTNPAEQPRRKDTEVSPTQNGEPTGLKEANPAATKDIPQSPAGTQNDDAVSKASTATGGTKTTADTSSRKSSGAAKVKRTVSSSRKSIRVTRVLDVPDPGPATAKADAKKKQPKRRRRTDSAKGARSPSRSRSSDRVEKQAKATTRREQGGKQGKTSSDRTRRGVRRRHSEGTPDLFGEEGAPSKKGSSKRKSHLKKVSKESKKAIASREKWSSEMGKPNSDASTTDDSTAVTVTSLPQDKIVTLNKSLSESMLGEMDDSSGTQEEEQKKEALQTKQKEVSEAILSVLNNSFSFEPDGNGDDKHNDTKDSQVKEEENVSNVDTKDSEGSEEEEEEKECGEGEKEVDAKEDDTDDDDDEKGELSGSQTNLKRQSGVTRTPAEPTVQASSSSGTVEPTDEGEVAELEAESSSEDEEELESHRVRKVLASSKRKKIDGLLGQLGSPCVA